MWILLCSFSKVSGWRVASCKEGVTHICSVVVDDKLLLCIPSKEPLKRGALVNPRKVLGIPRRPDVKENVTFSFVTNACNKTSFKFKEDVLDGLSLDKLTLIRNVINGTISRKV